RGPVPSKPAAILIGMAQPRTTPDRPSVVPRAAAVPAVSPKTAAVAATKAPAPAPSATPPAKPTGPRRAPSRPATTGANAKATAAEPNLAALKAQLVASVRAHYPQADLEPIERAFDLA